MKKIVKIPFSSSQCCKNQIKIDLDDAQKKSQGEIRENTGMIPLYSWQRFKKIKFTIRPVLWRECAEARMHGENFSGDTIEKMERNREKIWGRR
jgi:hypothetical protein